MNKQIYYHFLRSKFAIDDLEREGVKVSTLDTLNDPFEMVPYLRYRDSKKRQPYHKVRREIIRKYGLLCFSQEWGESLLWSHYADKHKGMAIGFEILQDEVIVVDYSRDPIRNQIILTDDQDTNEKLFLDLAKIKYGKWDYENEARILVKLEDCIKDKNYYFLPFDNRLKVREIILGCRFPHDKEKETVKKLAEKYSAKVVAARQGWEDYKVRRCGTKSKWYEDN